MIFNINFRMTDVLTLPTLTLKFLKDSNNISSFSVIAIFERENNRIQIYVPDIRILFLFLILSFKKNIYN